MIVQVKNKFLDFFRWFRTETDFPLESPFIYFVYFRIKLFSSCIKNIYSRKQRGIVCKEFQAWLNFQLYIYVDKHVQLQWTPDI